MSTEPIPEQRMLRLLLLASLEDVPLPRQIYFWRAGETGPEPTVRVEVGNAAAARVWSSALGLSETAETGQPWPLRSPAPEKWTGALTGQVGGWYVHLSIDEPYTEEHEAIWVAKGGPLAHPRDESAGGGSDA